MEEGLAARLVQVGHPHPQPTPARSGAALSASRMIEMKDWRSDLAFSFDGPVYLTFDLDALDPAFAPGVSHHEPGGLSVRDVLGALSRSSHCGSWGPTWSS
jgi:arginase family enzyme